MQKRTTRTYSIDDELYDRFNKIIESKNLNRSRIIEKLIKEYLDKFEEVK